MNARCAPLTVLIVDDEPPARERARRLLEGIEDTEIVGEANSGAAALEMIELLQPDVAFHHIQKPDLDRMRLLEAVDDPPAVIFSTAHEQYAAKAFDLEAVDYLLKPYSAERLSRALDRARRLLSGAEADDSSKETDRIPAQCGLRTELTPTDRIVEIFLAENVVFIIRDDGEQLISDMPLRDLEATLPSRSFFRVSRQAIVNMNMLESYEPTSEGGLRLQLKGGRTQTVSRRRVRHFRARVLSVE